MFEIKTCVTVRCEECENVLDEDYEVHYSTEDEAREGAEMAGWVLASDGKIYCGNDCAIDGAAEASDARS